MLLPEVGEYSCHNEECVCLFVGFRWGDTIYRDMYGNMLSSRQDRDGM